MFLSRVFVKPGDKNSFVHQIVSRVHEWRIRLSIKSRVGRKSVRRIVSSFVCLLLYSWVCLFICSVVRQFVNEDFIFSSNREPIHELPVPAGFGESVKEEIREGQ